MNKTFPKFHHGAVLQKRHPTGNVHTHVDQFKLWEAQTLFYLLYGAKLLLIFRQNVTAARARRGTEAQDLL